MILLGNGRHLVQNIGELPNFVGAKKLFLDVETTAFNDKDMAFFPYIGHRICGVAVTTDDCQESFYVPMRHSDKRWNLPLDNALVWLRDVVSTCETWVNHNVKFDAHFCAVDGAEFTGRLVDTLPLSTMYDTDKFTHQLKPLCREWCKLPMEEETRVKSYLKGMKSHNYADVPADILGEYACQDVVGARALHYWLEEHWPSEMNGVKETEIQLTPVLWDMERVGFKSDRNTLRVEQYKALKRMIELTDQLHDITGREFTNSNKWMFDILVNQFGMPILAYKKKKRKKDEPWNEGGEGSPTFDKAALQLYSVHPQVVATAGLKDLIEAVIEYRKNAQFKGLFLDTYLEMMDEGGRMHPDYNQVVRTGRMSCRKPNAQQLNKRAKSLIFPGEGNAFLSADASQIEFRLIIHYIKDPAAIAAYNNDATIDFHQWVADMCEVERDSGKTLNFGMAFGAHERTVMRNLAKNPDIIRHIGLMVTNEVERGLVPYEEQNNRYLQLCMEHSRNVYTRYHETLPGVKLKSKEAKDTCKARGFVFNAFGRRRHLKPDFARKAFNSVIQGSAMDFIKTRMVELSPRYNDYIRNLGIKIVANVHDEILFEGPADVMVDRQVQSYILKTLEQSPIPFRVPLVWDMGLGLKSWAEAVRDESEIDRESLLDAEEEYEDDDIEES